MQKVFFKDGKDTRRGFGLDMRLNGIKTVGCCDNVDLADIAQTMKGNSDIPYKNLETTTIKYFQSMHSHEGIITEGLTREELTKLAKMLSTKD